MLALVLGLGAFLGMLLMGASVLSMGKSERRWRVHASPDQRQHTLVGRSGPAFQPLRMEPFTLKWPSAIERRDTTITELPWPSETWDDEYFGTRSRDDVRRIAATAHALDEKRARTTQQAQRRQAGAPEPAPEAPAQPPKAKKQKKPKEGKEAKDSKDPRKKDAQQEAARRAGNVAEAAAQAALTAARETAKVEVAEVAEEFFRQVDLDPPTAEEIAALVRQYGLQTAIEHIRQRTGWDFQKATQHLAAVLRGQK